eukprot:TRINITY_DN47353_c0_g1_i1.p1 TRINITY_DN47353_c0_g1~~TRINITY_DN47353_c0_g1_i1.p1  ORF type:complete len:291 (+),score=83.00 TRINITY_DN47353_c0_g1_i1:75-947(+)
MLAFVNPTASCAALRRLRTPDSLVLSQLPAAGLEEAAQAGRGKSRSLAAGALVCLSGLRRQQRSRCKRQAVDGSGRLSREEAAQMPGVDAPVDDATIYLPVVIEMEDGSQHHIEARRIDTATVVKTVLGMELGIAEIAMELSMNGSVLEDNVALGDYGLKEFSKIQLKMREVSEEELEEAGAEEGINVSISVTVQGRVRTVKLSLEEEDNIGDVKQKAWLGFEGKAPFITDVPADQYGLFILEYPMELPGGNLRHLHRRERLKEDKTVAEVGLKGGEEIRFVHLMWQDVF